MEPSPNKISSSAIMERLDRIADSVAPLSLRNSPRPLLVYKPNQRDVSKGVAAKFAYYVSATPNEKGTYVNYNTSFFMEIVPQIPSDGEFARFGWRRPESTEPHPDAVTAKLGLPDLSALLLAYREVRLKGKPVPVGVRPTVKGEDGRYAPSAETNVLGLLHKFESKMTVIKWTFSADRSIMEISKGREQRKSISLTLQEEIQLMAYFQLGMEAMLLTG